MELVQSVACKRFNHVNRVTKKKVGRDIEPI
jgi:hypothetical protein